ncbi:hypothetical protein BDV95DRAFT_219718 [Massariosphaeria phaeospora]|uniref:Uncharacterized protein n=1 Tax=Massariosphaeria phaeospora TaxID=100035 RepID=A0A7C8MEF6_9PLEO|nr:hypothetical protein BDV95DRAFT_219718 [Massariosphaeria phaeospora]
MLHDPLHLHVLPFANTTGEINTIHTNHPTGTFPHSRWNNAIPPAQSHRGNDDGSCKPDKAVLTHLIHGLESRVPSSSAQAKCAPLF